MITAKQLAEKLGVSPSAVSLALNDRPGVSDETRRLIKEEARKAGYRKRDRKEAAVSTVRNIRYVIFLDSGMAVKETSFYSFVLRGIEAAAREYGFNVLVSYFSVDDDWKSQTKALSQDTSGMILLATELGEEHIKKLMENEAIRDLWSRVPVVLVDNSADTLEIDSVKSDNFRGGRIAADYLFDRGYADVGYLRSTTRITSFDERGRGLMASRDAHGVGKDKPLSVIDVGSSSIQAEKDMDAYLDAGNKPVPAYFADNDIIAAACIHSLKDHGYRVPEDVSVIGFDDMPLCTLFEPPLTTVGVKKTTIGRIAMGLLRSRIEDGQTAVGDRAPDACLRITLSARLIVRGSVI